MSDDERPDDERPMASLGDDNRPTPSPEGTASRAPLRHPWRARRRRFDEARGRALGRAGGAIRTAFSPVHRGRDAVRTWAGPRRKVVYPLAALLGIAVAAALPYLNEWFDLPLWLKRTTSGSALSQVALFSLFALGLNVVVGFAGLLDLGYVAFWAIGAYVAGIATGAAGYTKGLRAGTATLVDKPEWQMWMWGIILLALAASILAGIVLGSPTLRLRGDYLAIVTLGFGEIIQILAINLDGITVGPRGIASIPHPAIEAGPISIRWGSLTDEKYYWLLLVFVVAWIAAITLLDRSRIGRAWVAIREDEVAAEAMGVPVVRMKLAAFIIGASTAGVGGVIYAERINFINPTTFDIPQSILILAMVVIGGLGSIAGSILGAAAIVLLPEIFKGFEEYRFFVFGLALIVLMIFRPQGLLPSKRRKAELKGAVVEETVFDAHQGDSP